MSERNTNVLEVLIGQIAQDAYVVDSVICKVLGVLGQTERHQPLRIVTTCFPHISVAEHGTTTIQSNHGDALWPCNPR